MADHLSSELRRMFNFTIPFQNGLNPGRRALTPTWASNQPYGSSVLGTDSMGRPRSRFVGVEVNSSNVLAGLATLAGLSRVASQFPAQRAQDWKAAIVSETPRGADYRTQPKRYNLKYNAPTQLEKIKSSGAATSNKRYTAALVRQMEQTVAMWEREPSYGVFRGKNADLRLVRQYCRELKIPYESMISYMHRPDAAGLMAHESSDIQGLGRLQQSIQVNVDADQGVSTVTAYSDSYYAWFVEEGFLDTLKPVSRFKTENIVARVPLEQMGEGGTDYDYLKHFAFSPMISSGPGRDNLEGTDMVGGPLLVKLQRRESPIPRPGVFMFAKGTAKFITMFETEYGQEIDRMVRLAMEKNIRYDSQMRQFRGATGKGNKGSFMSSTIAQAVADAL